MTIKTVPAYPSIAKRSEWLKRKSLREKVKKDTKTGLGAMLARAEQSYAQIDFKRLDVKRWQHGRGKGITPTDVAKAKKAAQSHLMGHVKSAHKAVLAAANKADDAAQNQALSPASQNAAKTIKAQLNSLATKIDPARISLADFDAFKLTLEGAWEFSRVKLRKLVAKLEVVGDNAQDYPTVEGYHDTGLHQLVQQAGQLLETSPDPSLRLWHQQNWAALSAPKDDNDVIPQLIKVLEATDSLKKFLR